VTIEAFTAGGIAVDNVVASDGTLFRDHMGGNAVYSAAGIRLWLEHVGIVGVLPANYPMHWLERLRAAGIVTEGIHIVDEAVTHSEWFFYRTDGSRSDHLYADPDVLAHLDLVGDRLAPKASAQVEAVMRRHPRVGRSYGAFRLDHPVTMDHVPLSFLQSSGVHLAPNRPEPQCQMASALGGSPRLVTLDPGSNAEQIAQYMAAERLIVDALLPSEKELDVMVPAVSHESALARLIALGARTAAVKLGRAGVLLQRDANSIPVAVASLQVTARDPTGAGDAFCGGFLAGLIRTGDPLLAACCGTVSASFAVEAPGPFHLFEADRGEAARRLDTVRAGLPLSLPDLAAAITLTPSRAS
jgi:sugar/nucleoside kinase (ribokinase family)